MSATGPAERVDVTVVGAGVSGLRVAERLQRQGAAVRVLEARDRIGGRLLSPRRRTGSTTGDGRAIDLGATWFWPNENRVMQLIAEAGLSIFPQYMAGDMMFQAGPDATDPDQHRSVQRLSGNQLDVPSGRIAEGMAAIASALEARLSPGTIELNQPVSTIVSADDAVRVATPDRTLEASHVVLALPPALAVASIDFSGTLGDRVASVAAATPVWMGATIKVVAVFEQPFWRSSGLAGSAFSYAGPMREIHDMSGAEGAPGALFGFCSTPPAEPAPTAHEVTAQLVELFGDDAAQPTSIDVMDWRRESHTTPPDALSLSDYQTYGHPAYQEPSMDGRLHWASTETSIDAPGHVEGALAAADRAATTIHRALATTKDEQ